jgi:hypothetical protein
MVGAHGEDCGSIEFRVIRDEVVDVAREQQQFAPDVGPLRSMSEVSGVESVDSAEVDGSLRAYQRFE